MPARSTLTRAEPVETLFLPPAEEGWPFDKLGANGEKITLDLLDSAPSPGWRT